MNMDPAAQGKTRPARAPRRGWTLESGQADVVLATARKAFFVMVGVLVVIWAIQIVNVALGYRLTYDYGIMPHDIGTLPYILTAPFLHFSWTHIEGNSGPLFIFGFLAAYRGIGKWAAVTLFVILTSGFAEWIFASSSTVGAGASGVVFGYFGYIIVRGLFDRHLIDVIIGAVMALCFAYQFSVLLPKQGIGWQAHVGGVVGGIVAGWLFRDRSAGRAVTAGSGVRSAGTVAGTTAGTAIQPVGQGALTAPVQVTSDRKGRAGRRGKPDGKAPVVDPSNPRADLYKQLDDMGL